MAGQASLGKRGGNVVMKRIEQVTTTQGTQSSPRRRRLAAITFGREAPFGFDLREWYALGIVAYMGVLLVQFGLGMGINLFVAIPQNHPGSDASNVVVGFFQSIAWGIAHGPLLVAIHVVLGLIVLVHPLFVVAGLPPLVRGSRWPTAGAAICAWAAAASGAAYLTYHQDLFSLLMALGFGGAMLCYAISLALVIHAAGASGASASQNAASGLETVDMRAPGQIPRRTAP
jgi:hypothetical protein